ncbi:hypothetical protein [Massilia sp. TWR1-2-2]|uniref:hypothetical protein n=1 Tax=Massilia sp. TWR1-2-2 TaxID=2804584 RepID=UPI003CF6F18E
MNHALTISVPHLHTERLTLREYHVGESSRRVAERLGMTYEMKTELNGKGINSYMLEHM